MAWSSANEAETQPLLPSPYSVGFVNGKPSASSLVCGSLQEMAKGSPSRLR
jgi:hypothetical protein